MAAKQVLFHQAARERIVRGMSVLVDAVKETLGPRARTVLLERPFGPPIVINSGVVVARAIELPDPFENMGVQMVREVAATTSALAGDGTTTATLLAAAIVREGMKYVAAGMNPMDLKRGIEKASESVVGSLREMARPCSTRREMAQVAAISANNDEAVGALIAEAMDRVGREGVVTIEDGAGLASELQVVDGIRFDRGYLSPYFVNEAERQRVVLEEAWILVCDRKLSSVVELLPILEQVAESGRPLLLIAEDVEGEALGTLVVNNLRGVLKVCAVKAPEFGERRSAALEDIAALTGATVIGEAHGPALEQAALAQLGSAKRIEVDSDSCTLVGGSGDRARIDARLALIRGALTQAASEAEREQLQLRAASLAGGVAVVKVGGATETEMKERRARVEDALHAVRAAVAEGVLPGGGVALLRARAALDKLHGDNRDQQCGIGILLRALEEPLRQLAENSGVEASVVLERVRAGEGTFGFNAASGEFGDMMSMGILDPCKVTRTALQNAVSVADLILTTDCMVATLREGEDSPSAEPRQR
ncbi:MAG TPA: chaperonin GroEL [Aromatoleum sp.]|uniref:chaperonin GroEL n=1 Tax=Aromatoleum sp. TaxID=2307007 RepID=UPI002B47BAE4|nr:chaperonin GroEL [Aromatoleum sp.]HJV26757.1 chaperonin GroEL [Aromatoleum sp.]